VCFLFLAKVNIEEICAQNALLDMGKEVVGSPVMIAKITVGHMRG
jgi:hypothetical protein